ncbi:MAG: dipeptide ABC transporter ATP-binding protein [Deltaproteobacteria bacterium]|nr:dipeptide ABC transporter ATP-binding protein [Deltaproteobacteria bacterium]
MSLEIQHMDVVYGNGGHTIQALEDVNLKIGQGTCLALVGESGSGKTTLGKACLGLLPGNARLRGTILLNGDEIDTKDASTLNAIRWKKVAMLFQNGVANLNPAHRILNQVAEPLIQHGRIVRSEAWEHAANSLKEMGLSETTFRRYPHQLSGGQVQRALLAMALILDPDVLILDEPTSALDALTKGIVYRVIEERRSRGKAVLLITHDLEFAVRSADAMAVLYLGQVMESLPAKEIFSNPLHPYTLALKRSYPAMNRARDLGGIRGDAFYRTIHQHGHEDETGYSHSHIQVPGSVHKDGHAPPAGCLFWHRCTQAIEACQEGRVPFEQVGTHQVRCLRRGIVDRLVLKGVSKKYGSVPALYATDLTVKAGEIFSLVGETGSGKTTLAMTAAGMIRPDQGSRKFEGHDMDQWIKTDYRSLARRIGVIYQNPAESISHRFSVLETVAEPLTIHGGGGGKRDHEERVKKCLADVHLSTDRAFLDSYPHELNMGALQRVCMARALVLGPDLLIADEPTSSLDPSVQAKVLKLLLDLQIEMGLTMLFVSHDIGLVRKISDRIGVMLQGQLVEVGPASAILEYPRHPYTRLLIESVRGVFMPELNRDKNNDHPSGCPFAVRCPRRRKTCEDQPPLLRNMGLAQVACHFPLNVS